MTAPVKLTVVSGGSGLPLYPIPTGIQLESHFFMGWRHRDWLKSEFRLMADRDVRAVGFDLFCVAYDEDPAGTLPINEVLIQKLVDVSADDWRTLCTRSVGPLFGWEKCITDQKEIRLYNPLMLKIVTEASKARTTYEEKRAADRERKRLDALPDQMRRAGASQSMAENLDYVVRLDQYLLEHFPPPTYRRPAIVRVAMEAIELGEISQRK